MTFGFECDNVGGELDGLSTAAEMNAIMQEVVFDEGPPPIGEPLSAEEAALFAELDNKIAPAPRNVLSRGTNYSHEAMIDAIVANPAISQNELAAMFGYTAGWISQVINSDAFQSKLTSRIHELRDPVIIASMEEQFKGILARGLELTRNKLNANEVSDNFLLRSMELSSRALGYGAKKDDGGRNPNVEEKLADLSNNLVNLLKNKKREAVTIDIGAE